MHVAEVAGNHVGDGLTPPIGQLLVAMGDALDDEVDLGRFVALVDDDVTGIDDPTRANDLVQDVSIVPVEGRECFKLSREGVLHQGCLLMARWR